MVFITIQRIENTGFCQNQAVDRHKKKKIKTKIIYLCFISFKRQFFLRNSKVGIVSKGNKIWLIIFKSFCFYSLQTITTYDSFLMTNPGKKTYRLLLFLQSAKLLTLWHNYGRITKTYDITSPTNRFMHIYIVQS